MPFLPLALHPDDIEFSISVEAEGWLEALAGADEAAVERIVEAWARRALAAGLAASGRLAASAGGRPGEISIALTDDATVQELNAAWRGKDKPTNVLSFASLADDEDAEELLAEGRSDPVMLGDILLALETLQREAAAEAKTMADRTAHLTVHGMLHLLGYDHIVEDEAEEMERLETEILERCGVPDPYATGSAARIQG